MKLSTKISLMTSIAFIVIGSIMVALGFHYGDRSSFDQISTNSRIVKINSINDWEINIANIFNEKVNFDENASISSKDSNEVYSISEISNISIEIGAAKLVIEDSDDDNIHVSTTGISLNQIDEDNSNLTIKASGSTIKSAVIISLPSNASFNEVEIEAGAAEFNCNCFNCDDFNLNLGAGEAKIQKLIVNNSADIDISAGDLTIYSGNINNCDIDLALGNLEFTGTITNDLDIDCDMGNTSITLTDDALDHNYNLEAGMGNITFDGKQISGFGNELNQDNNANSNFDIECGMGNIEINFAK